MGGHEAGEVASQIAVQRIRETLADEEAAPTAERVVEAISSANGDIFRAAIANPGQAGMGTTVTVIAIIEDPMAGRGEPNIDDNDPIEPRPGHPDRPEANNPKPSCSPTSATRAPTCCATVVSDVSRSTTATCRNSCRPATSPTTRRVRTRVATSSPVPSASNPM